MLVFPHLIEVLIMHVHTNATVCTLSVLQVGVNDFYVRYHTVQLLTVLLQVQRCDCMRLIISLVLPIVDKQP